MPAKKSNKTVSAPEVVVAAAAPVVAEKKDKKVKKSSSAAPASVPAPVVESVVAPVPVVSDAAPVESDVTLESQASKVVSLIQKLGAIVSTIKSEYRALEKLQSREVKSALKASSKHKRKAGNRAPSGFVKPTKISDELATFLGKETGTEMARTEVTREINKYIRANNLQNKDNGRQINPDSKLAALLKLSSTDELTYFNLQRYMSPHFAKTLKVATA